ncbi:MAG: 1-deoxy-D-xylulose-5-phosphate reductoisomerase [Alphaproteobacteria bacterium]
MKKRVTILGSTGSVGQTALRLMADHPDDFDVYALVADSNADRLAYDAHRFGAKYAALADTQCYQDLKHALAGSPVQGVSGDAAIARICAEPVDIVIAAIAGSAGLVPTYQACQHARLVGIANKESLVCAGLWIMQAAAQNGGRIAPLDSEHHALACLLRGVPRDQVKSLVLTASGGPFRTRQNLSDVTPEEALRHPTWSMGKKISVDSATLMNKGLELIEACVLFDVAESCIETLIHPESVVHGMIQCKNGGTLAHLAPADMRYPVRDVLFDEQRDVLPNLSLASGMTLTFQDVDHARFPAITLARAAYRQGQAACVVLNAANECAVHAFLHGKLSFLGIPTVVEQALAQHQHQKIGGVQDVLALDQEVRQTLKKTLF